MKTTIALDVGDKWTGVAIADPMGIIARPLTTFETRHLATGLVGLIEEHTVGLIVVGLPKTLENNESQQTTKVRVFTEKLRAQFTQVEWIFWDERLTSKRAAQLHQTKTPAAKLRSHAIAAAFILDGYLARQAYINANPLE